MVDPIRAVFVDLLKAYQKGEIEAAVKTLEQNHAGRWRVIGDMTMNYSIISSSGSAENSAIERISNMIDATLELEASRNPQCTSVRSPREFVAKTYDIPEGSLNSVSRTRQESLTDELGMEVSTHEGDSPLTPTFDFRDLGVGLTAAEFPTTIASVARDNKISKWYLMGRYGQGGATALRFGDYALFASKKNDGQNQKVAFTIAKLRPQQSGEKQGTYVYLVGDKELPFEVDVEPEIFPSGTLVRHINYKLLSRDPSFIRVYSTWEYYLFDPVLPFRFREFRAREKPDLRRIMGSRVRLSTTPYLESSDEYEIDLKDKAYGGVILRYWLLENDPKAEDALKTFVDPARPIVVTYLGQTQDTLPRAIIGTECKLGYLERQMVIQLDLDGLTEAGRFAILTSTRERLTSLGMDLLKESLILALSEDEDLETFNEKRHDDLLQKTYEKELKGMRQRLAEMINRIRPGTFKTKAKENGGTEKGRKRKVGGRKALPPLPTIEFPTFVKIANHEDPIDFYPGQPRRIVVHSDAPDGFLGNVQYQSEISIGPQPSPPAKMLLRQRDFRGGRISISAVANQSIYVGSTFDLEVRMIARMSDGSPVELSDTRKCIVAKPPTGGEEETTYSDAPNIIPVEPGGESWKQLKYTEESVATVVETAKSVDIFVSMGNKWLQGMVQSSTYKPQWLQRLKNQYLLHVAFHSYLQHDQFKPIRSKLDTDMADQVTQQELDRAARTIVTAFTSAKSVDME